MYKKKRRRRRSKPYETKIYIPNDGLKVNRLMDHGVVSRVSYNFSLHDSDGVHVNIGGDQYYLAGIIRAIRRVNRFKNTRLNEEHQKVNRKAY